MVIFKIWPNLALRCMLQAHYPASPTLITWQHILTSFISSIPVSMRTEGFLAMTENAPSLAGRAMKNAWATPDDWERFRDTIKQLYLDQNKSLKEVMTMMDRDHDFHATSVLTRSQTSQFNAC